MSAGPAEQLLDTLLDPIVAFAGTGVGHDEARDLYAAGDVGGLAALYHDEGVRAMHSGDDRTAVRMLLAERSAARRNGDTEQTASAVHFLAQHHRVRARFVPAEMCNHVALTTPLRDETALYHARAWRELAAIREATADYDAGLACSARSIDVCERYPRVAAIPQARVLTLLQRSALLRQRGALSDALECVQLARTLAQDEAVNSITEGQVALREAGIEKMIGRPDRALAAYQRAEAIFVGRSPGNVRIARIGQVTCLREAGRADEALPVAIRVEAACRAESDAYGLGQILLEKAEVLQELGDHNGVSDTLAAAAFRYLDDSGLEALRWRRHLARNLLDLGQDPHAAAAHLGFVLTIAASVRRDLNRTMLALFVIYRVPQHALRSPDIRFVACRAALLGADIQRGELREPGPRWSLHGQREQIYLAAALVHAETDDAAAVAQIIETGRADVLNQLLVGGYPDAGLTDMAMPSTETARLDLVFSAAAEVGAALLRETGPAPLPDLPLPGTLPTADMLGELGDVVVMVQVGEDTDHWCCVSSVWTHRTGWRTSVQAASPPIHALLRRLRSGEVLPQRGITRATWDALGSFLFPSDEIWAGTELEPRSVVVCPDPRLWQLPLGALTRGKTYLSDIAELMLTPSLDTSRLVMNRRTSAIAGPALSILDPTLGGYDQELAALDAWKDGHRPISDLAELSTASLLYISGHGDEAGQESALGRGRTTMHELARRELPPLVFLNGCWSGTAASRYGTDPLSVAMGALLGGARTVVAGTGSIGGAGSAAVSAQALSIIGEGGSVRAAVRIAQRRVRTDHPELGPFEWAGLCVVGVDTVSDLDG
ncbi:hypothetical protein [Alloactinosynnema sp. L-07]|uniref:CHAT domain-containing protein n=1 Tax=Alloactinosynnema sp. L-07 TaxID=1653480 RepID=UPI00065EF26F|nr:CHAT domain-containing protein [Alloactinosynnema sp. L-07]CRK57681.1 hypothetical protein [Alloactinosynnema sp. L-07]